MKKKTGKIGKKKWLIRKNKLHDFFFKFHMCERVFFPLLKKRSFI